MIAPTDEQLLRQFLDGDRAAFELLVRRHSPELYQFATRLTGRSAAAEDVVQETFLQVHQSAGSFDPARRFKPWLFTIAANKARDLLRRRSRRRETPIDTPIGDDEGSGQRLVELLESGAPAPDDSMQLDEKRRLFRELVEDMPPRLWEVLNLAYYHHYPYKEIGEILGIPLGTVKSRLHAAIAWFAERYRAAVAARGVRDRELDG